MESGSFLTEPRNLFSGRRQRAVLSRAVALLRNLNREAGVFPRHVAAHQGGGIRYTLLF